MKNSKLASWLVAASWATGLAVLAALPGSVELERPERVTTRVHWVSASGKIDTAAIEKEIAKRGEPHHLEFGPSRTKARPTHSIFALSLAEDAKGKDALTIVKKGGRKPKLLRLSSIVFRDPLGETLPLPGGFSAGTLADMTSEMRWAFAFGHVLTLIYEDGGITGADLLKRTKTEARSRFDDPATPEFLVDELAWQFEGSISKSKASSLQRKLARHPGVVEATVDGEAGRVRLKVAFNDLEVTGRWGPVAASEEEEPSTEEPEDEAEGDEEPARERPTFFVNPILDEIERAGLRLPTADTQKR